MEVVVAELDLDLARETAGLLNIGDKSGTRSLNELVAIASRQVRACSGAAAALWHEADLVDMAASHPDICDLVEVEQHSKRGPQLAALTADEAILCPDTLAEARWPEYADAALYRGIRCSVTLAHRSEDAAVTLSLFGTRPRVLDPDQLPIAELLLTIGGAVLGNMATYGDVRRAVRQLREAAESRTVVDQAKGILMNAEGCTADQALAQMREISQQHNIKVTEVARRIIDTRLT
jgi:ANTAR domain